MVLQEQAQSLAFSVDGTTVIVGCTTGRWMVFDTQTREVLESHTDGAEPIQVIQCSPDGSMVALGSRDNNIYIYQVTEDGQKYNRVGRCMVSSLVFFFRLSIVCFDMLLKGCKSTRGKAMVVGEFSIVCFFIDWWFLGTFEFYYSY